PDSIKTPATAFPKQKFSRVNDTFHQTSAQGELIPRDIKPGSFSAAELERIANNREAVNLHAIQAHRMDHHQDASSVDGRFLTDSSAEAARHEMENVVPMAQPEARPAPPLRTPDSFSDAKNRISRSGKSLSYRGTERKD